MGTPDFALYSLEALIEAGHELVAVVTVPDKKQGRGQKLKPSPVKQCAQKHGLTLLQPESLRDEAFLRELKELGAELFVVVAFKILPREVFGIPPMGTLNVHASLLPAYRGAAPINWAIINGERESGVTTMLIDTRVDTGDILMQEKVSITGDMNAGDLHDLLAPLGARLLVRTLEKLKRGEIAPQKQDDRLASRAPKLTAANTAIDFNRPAAEVHNFIRGLSPYPGAYTFWRGQKLKILKAGISREEITEGNPGQIVRREKDRLVVACNPGAVSLERLQLQGKRQMSVRDFLNGYPLKTGEVLIVTELHG